MSELMSLIDDYRDSHGQPPYASIARAIDVAPQTINSWRNRGIRELPDTDILRRLAAFIGLDYETVVLVAALRDAGYMSGGGGDEEQGTAAPIAN